MAKPQSRQELILSSYQHHDRLMALIASLGPTAQTGRFAFKGRDHNVRDVLVQLAAWQKMYLDWSTANLAGTPARFMPEPYTWATAGHLSRKVWRQNQTTSLADAQRAFDGGYEAAMTQFEGLTNEQLFRQRFYSWTGPMVLGEYAGMVTAQHYAWAIKVLRRYKQQHRADTPLTHA
ncbi:ClbS/DfsB family four-helix bundle protein [Lacticaseibacillus absianus]|uniref:ClbS/DfsB family four-helix bundle protein n=1 Tax=Lacticaseibacillus absianus TaxID=2729623 RepID=UPI0015CC6479|nr:ClbS/DfsB family four-helix bundle protein [Lacticaseibacillus absianus]